MAWQYWVLIGGCYAALCAIIMTIFIVGSDADREQ